MEAKDKKDNPTVAPGMNTHDELEKKATEADIRNDDATTITRLYLDRTPEE